MSVRQDASNSFRFLKPQNPPALHTSISRIMSFNPDRLYLTHYGEFDNPTRQVSSFNRWIDDYVDLCSQGDSTAEDFEASLEQALQNRVLQELAGTDSALLAKVLQADLKLNAQGLAHWRRREQNG